jgi:hypothetical protein
MGIKLCCICSSKGPLTAEHKIKGSLLEHFNNLLNPTEDRSLLYDNGTPEGGSFLNIKKARILKPKKNICPACNSKRSSDCDREFHNFVVEAFEWQKQILGIDLLVSPKKEDVLVECNRQRRNIQNDLTDSLWNEYSLFINSQYLLSMKYQVFNLKYDEKLIKKYLAKHSICYFDRSGISAPSSLRNIFLWGTDLESLDFKIYFLPKDFQHGYLNTMIRQPPNELWYALIFSNLAIHVIVRL